MPNRCVYDVFLAVRYILLMAENGSREHRKGESEEGEVSSLGLALPLHKTSKKSCTKTRKTVDLDMKVLPI